MNVEEWLAEVPSIKEHFAKFGNRLPKGLSEELKGLEDRLEGVSNNSCSKPETRQQNAASWPQSIANDAAFSS